MNFKEWLLAEVEATSGKTILYPLGYGGIGLYPLQYYLPSAADAITYITHDKRLYHNGEGAPWSIKHIPPEPAWPATKNPNNGEGKPFSIDHVPPKTKVSGPFTIVPFH